MTPQERDLITTLLERLKDTTRSGQPKDPEADALIRQAMRDTPDVPYYLVQTVLIQDLSLHQAQNRIAELEQQLADASAQQIRRAPAFSAACSAAASRRRRLAAQSGGPWSRGPQVAAPPPQPGGYPPAGAASAVMPSKAIPSRAAACRVAAWAGMMGGGAGGGGFLRSAAATAAGIAGGALLFQGISSLFGHGYANSLWRQHEPGPRRDRHQQLLPR